MSVCALWIDREKLRASVEPGLNKYKPPQLLKSVKTLSNVYACVHDACALLRVCVGGLTECVFCLDACVWERVLTNAALTRKQQGEAGQPQRNNNNRNQ